MSAARNSTLLKSEHPVRVAASIASSWKCLYIWLKYNIEWLKDVSSVRREAEGNDSVIIAEIKKLLGTM